MTTCLLEEVVYGRRAFDTPGWTAGARSVVSYTDPCWFGWDVPHATVGAIVGLSEGSDTSTSPAEPRIGIHFQRGEYAILTNGEYQTEFAPYAVGSRFYLVRAEGLVFVCIRGESEAPQFDDVRVGSPLPGAPLWVIPDPFVSPPDEVFLDAALWVTGDVVDNAASGLWPYFYSDDIALAPDEFEPLGEFEGRTLGRLTYELAAFSRTSDALRFGHSIGAGDLRLELLAGSSQGDGIGANEAGMGGALRFEGLGIVALPQIALADGRLVFDVVAGTSAGDGIGANEAGMGGAILLEGFASSIVGNPGANEGSLSGRLELEGIGISRAIEGPAPTIQSGVVGGLSFAVSAATDPEMGISGTLPLDGFAADREIDAFMRGELTFRAVAGQGFDAVVQGVSGALILNGAASSQLRTAGIEGQLEIIGLGSDTTDTFAGGYLYLRSYARSELVPPAYLNILLGMQGAGSGSVPGGGTGSVLDSFAVGDMVIATYQNEVLDRISAQSSFATFYNPQVEVSDVARVSEALQVALVLRFTETVGAADTQQLVQAVNVLERALAVGTPQTAYTAILEVLDSIAVADTALPAYARTVLDTLGASSSVEIAIQFAALITDTIAAADSLQSTLTIFVEESAEFQVADEVQFTAQFFANVLDNVAVYALLNTPAELAQGWVMNTEGARPVSEYSNYAFNSLAFTGEQMIGAADDGLYSLEADDDAGDPIEAALSTMVLDFGTARQKRVRSAYIGYTSSGELVLKVRAVEDGEWIEYWYKGRKTTAQTPPGENYIEIGQNMKSRYWQFEIVNAEGADFELDIVELHPIILGRRV
jgi:hypothetical protein